MAVARSLGCQSEVEAMARLGFIFIHHTDGVNELQDTTRKEKKKREEKRIKKKK